MTNDERYVLAVLLKEIDFFRKGGVVRLLDTPLLLKSLFGDSVMNSEGGLTQLVRPCGECRPFSLVYELHHFDDVPCHHTFFSERRGPVEADYFQPKFEHVLTNWLRARITEIKDTSH